MTNLLIPEWVARLRGFTKLIVGFSGGLDSTVLLHVMASNPELQATVCAVHINHGISNHAAQWESHCKEQCQDLNIPYYSQSVEFDRASNIEEGARIARYSVFSSLLKKSECLLLGHHMDDQAETLLLQLLRGAGIDGLAAMPECRALGLGMMARPLLSCKRILLEHYAKKHHLKWIEDESNEDKSYTRNYLRHEIMPLLTKKWPAAIRNLAQAAQHCQDAKSNLDALAVYDSHNRDLHRNVLSIAELRSLPFERMTNIVRVWLLKNHIPMPSTATFQRIIFELIEARPDANPEIRWGDVTLRRYKQSIYISPNSRGLTTGSREFQWNHFPAPLILDKSGCSIIAKQAYQGFIPPKNAEFTIRFRQGGEHIRLHGQTKSLKKLFQTWKIPTWERDTIPLIYVNNELAVIVGYAISEAFYSKDASNAWDIQLA